MANKETELKRINAAIAYAEAHKSDMSNEAMEYLEELYAEREKLERE